MKRLLLITLLLLAFGQLPAQTYTAAGGAIPDDGQPHDFTLAVSGLNPAVLDTGFGLLSVCVDITHAYAGDLRAWLVAPDGTEITLFRNIGGGGNNFTATCMADTAPSGFAGQSAPFTGVFSPFSYLGDVNNGQAGDGAWTLRLLDRWQPDAGTLNSWSLTFGAGATGPLAIDSTLLPILLINTNGQAIPDDPKITADLRILHKGGGQYNFPTDPANAYDGKIGIEVRGASSASYPQTPYGFETRDSLGNNLNVGLLGMPAENDWTLLSFYNDKSFVRNALAFEIFRKMGHWAPRTRLVEVILNGEYRGIYLLTEKIKRDKNRVDIAKLDIDDNAGDSLTGGYMFKLDIRGAQDYWQSNFSPLNYPNRDIYFLYEYPAWDDINFIQQGYLQNYVNGFETALYGPDFADPALGYRAWIDVPSFIDYMLVNELARNNDGFKKSRFWHKDRDQNGGLLKAGPVWDFDWAWKNLAVCNVFSNTNGANWAYNINDCNPDVDSPGWTLRFLQDTSFANELRCRYDTFRTTVLDTLWLFNYIDSVQNLVDEAQVRHYQKWSILGLDVGAPEVGPLPVTWPGELAGLKEWIRRRVNWLDANVPGTCWGPVTAVAEGDLPGVRVFPNPASRFVIVESSRQAISRAELWDLQGRKLAENAIGGTFRMVLPLDKLSPGIYLVKIITADGNVLSRRVIRD